MFAKAFIVAATFLVEQASPATIPAAPLTVAAGPSAAELVTKVQSFYQSTGKFTAKFRQNYTNKAGFNTEPKDGRIYVKKPGKMRWDYKGKSSPVRASYLTDGTNAWMVEYDNKQFGRQALTENTAPVAITFLSGKGDLAREFNAFIEPNSKYSKTDHVLKLIPKKVSAQYKELYLVVDPVNFRVKQSIVIEGNGNVNHFMFFEPDFSKELPDGWFWVNESELKKQGFRVLSKKAQP